MHCTSSTAHAKQLTALEYLCKSFSVYLKIIHLADLTVTDRIAWNDRYSQSNSNAIFCILLSTKDIKAMRSHCCCLLSLPFFIRTMPPLRDPSIGRPNNMIVDNRKRSRPNATANTFINSILILFRNGWIDSANIIISHIYLYFYILRSSPPCNWARFIRFDHARHFTRCSIIYINTMYVLKPILEIWSCVYLRELSACLPAQNESNRAKYRVCSRVLC